MLAEITAAAPSDPLCPLGYSVQPFLACIHLRADGSLVKITGPEAVAVPTSERTGQTLSRPGLDNWEYTFGQVTPKLTAKMNLAEVTKEVEKARTRAPGRHAHFLTECARLGALNPILARVFTAVRAFIESPTRPLLVPLEAEDASGLTLEMAKACHVSPEGAEVHVLAGVDKKGKPRKAQTGERLLFRVEGCDDWWLNPQMQQEALGADPTAPVGQCQICLERRLLARLIPGSRLGAGAPVKLCSFQDAAVASYGYKQAYNASICIRCAQNFSLGLVHLGSSKETCITGPGQTYIRHIGWRPGLRGVQGGTLFRALTTKLDEAARTELLAQVSSDSQPLHGMHLGLRGKNRLVPLAIYTVKGRDLAANLRTWFDTTGSHTSNLWAIACCTLGEDGSYAALSSNQKDAFQRLVHDIYIRVIQHQPPTITLLKLALRSIGRVDTPHPGALAVIAWALHHKVSTMNNDRIKAALAWGELFDHLCALHRAIRNGKSDLRQKEWAAAIRAPRNTFVRLDMHLGHALPTGDKSATGQARKALQTAVANLPGFALPDQFNDAEKAAFSFAAWRSQQARFDKYDATHLAEATKDEIAAPREDVTSAA